jgi:hypothetical protein
MSETNKPLLSIVIPTKNRYYYLKFIVEYFHSIESSDIELVIQDNSDFGTNHDFFIYLSTINDHRITYSYIEESISVVENSDRAIAKSRGKFVSLIGDDDIFSKHILRFLSDPNNNQVDSILLKKAFYTWPDVKPRLYGERLSGKLILQKFNNKIVSVNSLNILKKVIHQGGVVLGDLPCVYHGIIRREILEQVFELTGSYFPGPSPDMANAVALSLVVKKHIKVNIPLIVAGHSYSSAGGQGAQGQHNGEIENVKHLPIDTAAKWTKKIPFFWSGNTIYAESVVKSLEKMKAIKYLELFNYDYLYASCLVYENHFKDRVYKLIQNKRHLYCTSSKIKVVYYYFVIWIKRFWFHTINNIDLLFPYKLKKYVKYYEAKDTIEVISFIDNILEKKIP